MVIHWSRPMNAVALTTECGSTKIVTGMLTPSSTVLNAKALLLHRALTSYLILATFGRSDAG